MEKKSSVNAATKLAISAVAGLGLSTTSNAAWTGLGAGGSATDISSVANYSLGTSDIGNLSSITSSVTTLDMGSNLTTGAGGLDLRLATAGTNVGIGDAANPFTLNLGGNILLNRYLGASAPAASVVTLGSEITLSLNGADRTISGTDVGSGGNSTPTSLNINGTLALGNRKLTVGSGVVTVNGQITGSAGSILYGNVSGTGLLTLTNANNSFTGGLSSGGFGNLTANATTVLANTGTNSALGAGGSIGFGNSRTLTVQGFTAAQETNRTFAVIGNSTFSNSGSNSVTLTGSVINDANNGIFNFGGTYNGASGSNVISGVIQNGTKLLGINVGGSVWRLSNNSNSYTSATSVGGGGVLEFTTIKNVNAGVSSLGSPADATAGEIGIGSGGSGTLRFVGTNAQSSDRRLRINDNGSSNSYTVTANGAAGASLTMTSGMVYDGTAQGHLSRTLTLDGTNTDANTMGNVVFNYASTSANASTANGNAAITKTGVGLWVLSGTNAYNFTSVGGRTTGTFTTNVNNGVLRLGSAGAIPGGIGATGGTSLLNISGGVLELGVGDFTRDVGTSATTVNLASGGFSAFNGNRNVNLGGAAAAKTWGSTGFLTAGNLTLSAATSDSTIDFKNSINLGTTGTNTRTIQVNDGSAVVDAILSGNLTQSGGTQSLTKSGSGLLQLDGQNTYAGATTVTDGVLRVNGSISGNVLVNTGTLQGTGNGTTTGTIGGSITVGDVTSGQPVRDAVLAPGNSIGTLTPTGPVTLNADSTLQIELSDLGSGKSDGSTDLLNGKGALTINANAALSLMVTGTPNDTAFVIAKYSSLTGTFSLSNVSGLPNGYEINYNYLNGNQIAIVAVPEPAAIGLIGVTAVFALRRRRAI